MGKLSSICQSDTVAKLCLRSMKQLLNERPLDCRTNGFDLQHNNHNVVMNWRFWFHSISWRTRHFAAFICCWFLLVFTSSGTKSHSASIKIARSTVSSFYVLPKLLHSVLPSNHVWLQTKCHHLFRQSKFKQYLHRKQIISMKFWIDSWFCSFFTVLKCICTQYTIYKIYTVKSTIIESNFCAENCTRTRENRKSVSAEEKSEKGAKRARPNYRCMTALNIPSVCLTRSFRWNYINYNSFKPKITQIAERKRRNRNTKQHSKPSASNGGEQK